MFPQPDAWPSDASHRPSGERILYEWPLVQVGRFDCWPDDARWSRPNRVDEGHVVAFPGRAVRIQQDGDRTRLTDPHRLVFYNRDQTYRRGLVSRDGDHCTYLVVSTELLDEMARADLAPIGDVERRPFPTTTAPSQLGDYLEMQAIVHDLSDGRDTRELELQERLVGLVARVVRRLGAGAEARDHPRARRAATRRVRAELVEAARAELAADAPAPLTLQVVAARLGVSVFHLSRVFRQQTGMGLHAYRDQLRLRGCLPLVLGGSVDLTQVALAAGYASHSHFTDRFRALYGVAPSRLRARVRGGRAF